MFRVYLNKFVHFSHSLSIRQENHSMSFREKKKPVGFFFFHHIPSRDVCIGQVRERKKNGIFDIEKHSGVTDDRR